MVEIKQFKILIYGDVQGVFFRSNIFHLAKKHKIKGYVMNNLDGTVEAVLQGFKEDIQEILDFCRHGPSGASIDHIEVKELPITNKYKDFEILH